MRSKWWMNSFNLSSGLDIVDELLDLCLRSCCVILILCRWVLLRLLEGVRPLLRPSRGSKKNLYISAFHIGISIRTCWKGSLLRWTEACNDDSTIFLARKMWFCGMASSCSSSRWAKFSDVAVNCDLKGESVCPSVCREIFSQLELVCPSVFKRSSL